MSIVSKGGPIGPSERRRPTWAGQKGARRSLVRKRAAKAPVRRGSPWLGFDCLEELTLLSSSIAGTVTSDANGTGVADQTVFLDLNHDHTDDSTSVTVTNSSPTVVSAPGQITAITGPALASLLPVQSLPSTISDLQVNMDVVNNSAGPITVGVFSPYGTTIPNFPTLFILHPGQHFVGSFDGNAQNPPITLAGNSPAPGTYQPLNNFTDPPAHIYDGNPNGTWGLVFIGDTSHLKLNTWSLTFKVPDPSTTTDANGNYAFTGLAPGSYAVETVLAPGASQTSPAGAGAAQNVTVADGQSATGVDFAIQPASDLSTTAFYLTSPAAGWGQKITVNYTLSNEGNGAAGAFEVDLVLSSGGTIDESTGIVLQPLHFAGLAANSSTSGAVTVTLPGGASGPPAGFGSLDSAEVGFVIDPHRLLPQNDAADSSNQGLGVDTAVLATAPNVAVSSGAATQQDPSVAVDPTDSNHVVVAYMDYSLVSTGYAGIGVAVSEDGGKTWSPSTVPLPAGFNQGAADPTVQFGQFGGQEYVYVSFMAATFLKTKPGLTDPSSSQRHDGFESNNGIFVARSGDGGTTWGQAFTVASNSYTGTDVPFELIPDLAVDPHNGNLYVAWVHLYPAGQYPGQPSSTGGSDIYFATSSDGGAHWTTQMQTVVDPNVGSTVTVSVVKSFDTKVDSGAASPGRGFTFYPQVTVGPGGDIYVSAYEAGAFDVFHSSDGGTSFVPPDPTEGLGVPFQQTGLNILPGAFFGADAFRTTAVRDIVADPSHPGRVYVTDANSFANAALGTAGVAAGIGVLTPDSGDIVFAVSNDYGLTWEPITQVGADTGNLSRLPSGSNEADTYISLLNDDNNGDNLEYDSLAQLSGEVQDSHAMPSMSVDASGRLTVIWYDSRRDPTQNLVDVFGTVSTDGGETFSPNFRITDTSFNPYAGAFKDGSGHTDYFIGEHIAVAAANGVAYAVWTDTRNNVQQIYSAKYSLTQPPAPPLNRLYPNNTANAATFIAGQLPNGGVVAPTTVPRMSVGLADDNWYAFIAGSDGRVFATATISSGNAGDFQLQLTDASGTDVLATTVLISPGTYALEYDQAISGNVYLLHASNTDTQHGAPIDYSLTFSNNAADLGTGVVGSTTGVVAPNGTYAYPLQAGVSGSLALTLTQGPDVDPAHGLTITVISPLGLPLASGSSGQVVTVPGVTLGQSLIILVQGVDGSSAGSFGFQFTNLDQFETPGTQTLFFPTTGSPSSIAVANLGGPNQPADIIVSSTNGSDPVNVLTGNGDGTFQAARQYDVGPGLSGGLDAGTRQIGVADLTGDGTPDIIVPNFRASDVSVLLGNGDGTLQPQRVFDAVASPGSLATGNFVSGSNNVDAAVLQSSTQFGSQSQLAILIGRGDGTFEPAVTYPTIFTDGAGPIVVGDFNHDGNPDIVVFSKNEAKAEMFLGTGNAGDPFQAGKPFDIGEAVFSAKAVDIDGDGNLDLVYGGTNTGNVYISFGLGDGTFAPPYAIPAVQLVPGENVGIGGLDVVDYGSATGNGTPGTPDGHLDIVVTAQTRAGNLPAQVILLPAETDSSGNLIGYGTALDGNAVVLATVAKDGQITHGDFTGNGATDLAVADNGGVTVIYQQPPTFQANTTAQTARNLGSAAHVVTQAQAILAPSSAGGQEDAYFKYTVPNEALSGSGPEVIDFSALFQDVTGAGLEMDVTDAGGAVNVAGQASTLGNRFRVVAPQGDVLMIHIHGDGLGAAASAGVYTLDIDVLPQVVSVQAPTVVAGAAATSIVITLQGDRLDPLAAENPANYVVTYLGAGGASGQVIPVAASDGGPPVVYDPSANIDVTSGLTYPTAVRQTITLLFARPLPPGSYQIDLSPAIQAAPYGQGESALLAQGTVQGHPLVSMQAGVVVDGARVFADNLVAAPGATTNVATIAQGSAFLTQLQGDLSALLNQLITLGGDDPAITASINDEIISRLAPLFAGSTPVGPGVATSAPPAFAVMWFDPVSIDLQAPQGGAVSYSLASNAVTNNVSQTFVQVGGNVELLVLANASGTFNLDVSNVPSTARGGGVQISANGVSSSEFTGALREGTTSFQLELGGSESAGPSGAPEGSGGGGAIASAVQTGIALLSTGVVSTPVAISPSTITANESAEAPAGVTTATTTASTANAPVVTPLPKSSSTTSGSDEELLINQDETLNNLRPIVRSTLQFMKKLTARVSGVVNALGMGRGLISIQLLDELLDVLTKPAEAGAGDNGAQGRNQDANPAPPAANAAPAAVPADAETSLDAIDRILHEQDFRAVVGRERNARDGAEPDKATAAVDAYWAIAFLAAGAYHARLRAKAGSGPDPNEKRIDLLDSNQP